MDHSILSTLDLVIIGVYLVAMVSIGLYFVRRIKGSEDYYVAGRSFGPLILMATVCATIIGGSGLMGRAGKAYSFGTMAITTALPYLIGMFIFSGISGRISRMGTRYDITSMPELFEKRFGKTAKIILACMVAFTMMGTVASQVTATATIIKMLGGNVGISYEAGAMIACVVFMLYTATSGLFGVVFTDVFQFYMLLLFVYILIPTSAVHYVGGWSNFTANLSPELTKPYINGSIVGDIVTYLVFTLAGAEMWQRAFAAKSDKSAKRGMFLGTTVYGLTILLVYLMGIIGHQILGDNVLETFGSTDAVVPALAVKVLPVGLTGLVLQQYVAKRATIKRGSVCVRIMIAFGLFWRYPPPGTGGGKPCQKRREPLRHRTGGTAGCMILRPAGQMSADKPGRSNPSGRSGFRKRHGKDIPLCLASCCGSWSTKYLNPIQERRS